MAMVYGAFDPGIYAYLGDDGELIGAEPGMLDLCIAAFNAVLLLFLCFHMGGA